MGPYLIEPGTPGLRRHVLIEPLPGLVRGSVEDDFHHFSVEIAHDGHRIQEVQAAAHRYPWSLCPASSTFLESRLTGTELSHAATFDAQLSHCTHQFDLALVAAAHAREQNPTLFSMFVSDPVDGRRRAELRRNGVHELAWLLADDIILPPADQAGLSLRQLSKWICDIPDAQREAMRLLRRAAYLSGARQFAPDQSGSADRVSGLRGACYVYQPERAGLARRTIGHRRDFSTAAEGPLAARARECAF
jgi:hypothetical protein